MTQDEDIQIVDRAVNELAEHFDTVQIFVTRHMPAEQDGTISLSRGAGNWHARYGVIRTWLVRTDEQTRREVTNDR